MPDPRKVRWSQLKVGVVALAAFTVVFVLVFLLTSSKGGIFQRSELLLTYMNDASGIADGSVVRLNGYTIGYLDKLRLTDSRDPKRAVEFRMMVNGKYLSEIPVDSVAAISAANLLGDKFINITKGQDRRTVNPGDELKSLQGQDIPELMAQMTNTLESFQTIVNRVDSLLAGVEQGKGNLGKFLKDEELYGRMNGIASELQKILADLRTSNGTISKLFHDEGALYEEFRAPVKRIDSMLAEIQAGQGNIGLLLKDRALYDDFKKSVVEFNGLLADLQAGKGTAGKFLKDDQLHNRLDLLVTKFSGIVDKMNAGQGTLGQFLVNPQFYESLNGVTREFQSLAKDMRANPKKFLTIRLTLF
ncbi:MAG TPA: MlaD family protein [Bryobacteraceae bacterium]|jgi:phospholipid/cholesterol/gamma-HCH transport system substrate-binding protein|nr:MlaD family protein [Bryobacteraceae bacterium]